MLLSTALREYVVELENELAEVKGRLADVMAGSAINYSLPDEEVNTVSNTFVDGIHSYRREEIREELGSAYCTLCAFDFILDCREDNDG